MSTAPADTHRISGLQQRIREETLTQHHASVTRLDERSSVLKCDDTFLIADQGGDIDVERHQGLGFFYRDTRFLNRLRLTLEGQELIALSSQHGGGNWSTH